MPNGKENLRIGNEKHGAYMLVNRGVVQESNRDVAEAMEALQNDLTYFINTGGFFHIPNYS